MTVSDTLSHRYSREVLRDEPQHSEHSGSPVPHPAILEGYEHILPGAAARIFDMAESYAKHQQEMERALLKASEDETERGQFFALYIGLAALAASVISACMGHPFAAGTVGGAAVIGLVIVFIAGRFIRPSDEQS